jgi:hypothetical protein
VPIASTGKIDPAMDHRPRPRSPARWLPIAATAFCVVTGTRSATAVADGQREPILVIGLRPAAKNVDGPSEIRRLSEAQRLRRVANDVVRDVAHRPIIDDAGLRTTLGVEYLVDFMDCRGKVACVARVVAKLKKTASLGVYGEYAVVNKTFQFRFRLMDLGQAKILKEVEFKLEESDVEDRKLWRRELEPLADAIPSEPEVTTPTGPTTGGPTTGGPTTGGPTTGGPTTGGPTTGGPTTGGPTTGGGEEGTGIPELAPISTEGAAEGAGAATGGAKGGSGEAFIDNSVLEAISRGISWHGHFQDYTAMGIRHGRKGDLLTFEDRLQLEFESDINQVRVVGKPQLVYNHIDEKLDVQFREMYAARDYKKFDVSVGQKIVTWGITDFWPIVDIVNPRNFSVIRNWRPIDEKVPIPTLESTWLFGRLTFHLLGIPYLKRSSFQLDQARPFALPIPAPGGTTVGLVKSPAADLSNVGGGVRVDLAVAAWKVSFYGLVGHDVLPAVHADVSIDPANPTNFAVDNDRVAMVATSVQGTIDALGTILKAEAAAYHRLNDDCAGKTGVIFGVPECFYLRRVPSARVNIAFERHILPGLDAHLQLISEITYGADKLPLPENVTFIAPGLPEQYAWNKIVTLRLQGMYKKDDFRPMAFVYWSKDDEALFINVDLEHHIADGFALALGGFWFQGYAKDPNKDRYTLVGSMEGSSNVYLRATAWF